MVFAISDLHLSFGVDKPMDVFGPKWENYMERIRENWISTVAPGDTVVLPGDLSWGISLSEALPDFQFLDKLPGKKIIGKGNHDYFWETASKINRYFVENGIETISLLYNNAFLAENMAVCGTKGYSFDNSMTIEQNEKLLNRELGRLQMSIDQGRALGAEEIVVFLHYPPVVRNGRVPEFMEKLAENRIKRCFYGHIHSGGFDCAVQGIVDGIEFKLVSADCLSFTPLRIK